MGDISTASYSNYGPMLPERCPHYCAVAACDECGEMALDKGRGPFCPSHPDAKIVTLRRETCTHGEGEPTVPLSQLSAAVDEIYALRRALAYEANVTKAHLDFKTFPKSRRLIADHQIARMREAAQGRVHFGYGEVSRSSLNYALRDAGAEETLTNTAWLEQSGWTDG